MNLKKIFIALMGLVISAGIFIGDKCMAKGTLTTKQQNIVMISSYTAKGDLDNLEKTLNKALDEGMSVNEIKEILIQAYAYCGFPRSLNGLSTFMKVMDSREDKNDKIGKEGSVLPGNTKIERLIENSNAADIELSTDELKTLNEALSHIEIKGVYLGAKTK